MSDKKHEFVSGIIINRRLGARIRTFSTCQTCNLTGEKRIREISGRMVTYWQHLARPKVEPTVREACDWSVMGGLWCCKKQGHDGGHHAHRGPRRDVAH